MVSRKAFDAFVRAAKRDLRHRVAQHAGSDRVALGVVGIEEAFRRGPVDHLGQLPSQIHRILHTDLEALSTIRGMDVCGVAGLLHRGGPQRRRAHVGEPDAHVRHVPFPPFLTSAPTATIAQSSWRRLNFS